MPNKPDMPVTMGLHNFRLKAGQSIELDAKGNIFIVGGRGKRTDTGKNIYVKPVTFQGGPLAGDIKGIRYTVTKPYHNQKQSCHPLFHNWKGIVGLTEGLSFRPYTNESNVKLKNPSEIKLFSLVLGDARLVASSKNPEHLLYIEVNGERFFQITGGPTRDIPLTADYVQKCQRGYRDYLTAEQKKQDAEMTTHGLPERITKAEREYLERKAKKMTDAMLEVCVKEAGEILSKQYNPSPIITRTQSMITAGILSSSEANLRKAEDEMDAELNRRKPSKLELAALATKLYNEMKVRSEDKIVELVLP